MWPRNWDTLRNMPIKKRLPIIREQVLISYNHIDKKWLERLRTMVMPLVRDNKIDLWDDTRIQAGTEWREEIEKALLSAKVAVLLVSPDYLASEFIAKHELPPLLDASHNDDLTIIWIPVRASMYRETEIARYQAAINPEKPLAQMRGPEQEKTLVAIGEVLNRIVNTMNKDSKRTLVRKRKAGTTQNSAGKMKKRPLNHEKLQEALVPGFAPRLVEGGDELRLINIGNGTGVSIEIDPVNLQFKSLPDANITFE